MPQTTTDLIRRTLHERAAAVTPQGLRHASAPPLTRRTGRRVRHVLAPVAAALAVVAVAGVVFVLRNPGTPAVIPAASATPTGPPDAMALVPAQLADFARQLAIANDEPHPSAFAVRTTFREAEAATDSGSSPEPDGGTPVWLVQVLGNFVCNTCSGPAGHAPITGTAMILIVNAGTLDTYSFQMRPTPIDLAPLGAVVTVELSGTST